MRIEDQNLSLNCQIPSTPSPSGKWAISSSSSEAKEVVRCIPKDWQEPWKPSGINSFAPTEPGLPPLVRDGSPHSKTTTTAPELSEDSGCRQEAARTVHRRASDAQDLIHSD